MTIQSVRLYISMLIGTELLI